MVFSGKASRCGKIEKPTTPRVRSSSADGHATKSAPILGVITMLPALTPTHTMSGSDGKHIGQPGLPHPVAQVRRVAAVDQEHAGLPDPGDPSLRADGGQCRELEDTQRCPPQAGVVPPRGLGGDEAPYRSRTAHRWPHCAVG